MALLQTQPGSTLQKMLQPSPAAALPSSQISRPGHDAVAADRGADAGLAVARVARLDQADVAAAVVPMVLPSSQVSVPTRRPSPQGVVQTLGAPTQDQYLLDRAGVGAAVAGHEVVIVAEPRSTRSRRHHRCSRICSAP
jgi:hypothetical protein